MSPPRHYDDVPMAWVGDWSGRRARFTPQREAVFDAGGGQRFNYAALDARARRVGAFLLDELALKPGEVVCFISRNRVEPLDLYFACGKLGTVLAPLSYRLQKPELDDLLRRLAPQALFVEENFAGLAGSLDLPPSVRRTVTFGGEGSEYERAVLGCAPRAVNRPLALNDLFMIVHTGGTTAVPKLCRVTHRQMVWNSFDLIATGSGGLGLGGKELVTFPLFHIGGWNTVTPVFHLGGTAVLMREFDPDLALSLIERERITHFGGVEAMLRMMIESSQFAEADLSSVRYVNSAGAPCAAEVMRPFWDKGVPLTQSYGLTEAGPSNCIFLPDPPSVSLEDVRAHAESIGFPMFHCEAKVVDPQTGRPVAPGQVGELWWRSPHNFEGYLEEPERSARVPDEEGWVHSGDLAVADEAERLRIIGRVDHTFISGGENVSPEEIERALLAHPAVAQAGAVGVPDARWGQVALVAVVLAPGTHADEETLRAFLGERLARFKVPQHWRFVVALPLTGAGKLDRNALGKLL